MLKSQRENRKTWENGNILFLRFCFFVLAQLVSDKTRYIFECKEFAGGIIMPQFPVVSGTINSVVGFKKNCFFLKKMLSHHIPSKQFSKMSLS
jgi:hypothetical protein